MKLLSPKSNYNCVPLKVSRTNIKKVEEFEEQSYFSVLKYDIKSK